jgi:hypothetical protein
MTGGDYEKGVIAGTNIGRDSDTIANLIGGLSGAMHGINAIPREWREGVREINPQIVKTFEKVARDFSDLIHDKMKKFENIASKLDHFKFPSKGT